MQYLSYYAKNIRYIAPLLAEHFMDLESVEKAFKEYQELIQSKSQSLGLYQKYLDKLHDSWFIKTNITDERFSITLNDFTTHVFSDVIVGKNKLEVDHDKLVFPIQLDFEITNLSFNTVDENGDIRIIQPTTVSEYLFEQLLSISKEEIEIGLVVWKDGIGKQPGKHILILMRVKEIILSELQDNAWADIFGNAYDKYYEYFKSQREAGRYLSDQSTLYKLYDECAGQFRS